MDMAPVTEEDPGKGWRRLARAAAVLGIVLPAVPDAWGHSLWSESESIRIEPTLNYLLIL